MARTKQLQEPAGTSHVRQWIWGILGTLVAGLAWGGWQVRGYIAEELASKADVTVVQVQVQSLYDVRIEQLTIQRDRLVRKPNKSAKDLQDLKDIEKELELARKMRAIK